MGAWEVLRGLGRSCEVLVHLELRSNTNERQITTAGPPPTYTKAADHDFLFFLFSFPVTCSICSMFPETEGFIETPKRRWRDPLSTFWLSGSIDAPAMQHVRLGVGLSCVWAAVFPVPLPCVVARNWKNRTPQQCKSDDLAPTQQGMLGQIEESNDRTNCLQSKPRQGVGVIRGLRPHDSMLRHDVGPAQMTSKGCPLITRRKRDPGGNVRP